MSAKRAKSGKSAEKSLGLEAFRQPPDEAGLSLDQLSQALSGMLQSGEDPYASPGTDEFAESEIESSVEPEAAADNCELNPRTILEAILFVGHPQNEPLAAKDVAALMRGVRPAEIDSLVRELNRDYQAQGCPYFIVTSAPSAIQTAASKTALASRGRAHWQWRPGCPQSAVPPPRR